MRIDNIHHGVRF